MSLISNELNYILIKSSSTQGMPQKSKADDMNRTCCTNIFVRLKSCMSHSDSQVWSIQTFVTRQTSTQFS